ncbi:SipW-dependent-type signal peptide-containing protein [Cryobacterium frigoriphilum]|uniref:SipW-dependent-type signal peptide-containing protein n=1 Tax=Cryobacterium frigoriphilum TaxID=1259150 RepID=UPI00141B92EB|nr:SipW-dependent-type signal peptide-containing protein [Cryobacterium frigoriphilum]
MLDVDQPSTSKSTRPHTVKVRLVLALCALLGIGAYGTSASFTDASFVRASFQTGTLELAVAGATGSFVPGDPTALSLTQLSATGMYPGGPAGLAELHVKNNGQLPLTVSGLIFTTTNSGGIANDSGTTALGQLARLKVVPYSGSQVCNAAFMTGDGTLTPTSATVSSGLPTLTPGTTATFCLKVNIPSTVSNAPLAALNVDMRVHIRVTAVQA